MARVTLSFDNGPEPDVTPRVLDIPGARGIKSSFFVLGRKLADAAARPFTERAKREGHWIANHTYTHTTPLGRIEDASQAVGEIAGCEAEIGGLAETPKLFRPLGGAGKIGPHLLSRAARDHLMANDYTCVLWNSIPADWEAGGEWVERALEQTAAQAWSLVVLHDIPGGCVDDLERFLDALEARGDDIVQDFPPACLPIVAGQLVRPDALPEPAL